MDTSVSPVAATIARLIDDAVARDRSVPSLAELARAAHVSPSHLRRVFTRAVGVSPHAYADARRAERLRSMLSAGRPVADAIGEACFGSPSRVYERTGELLGMTPGTLQRGAPGERIRYALADSSLGRVVVASTTRGVCLVAFGESDEELAAEVRRRFPRAAVEPSPLEEEMWVAAVVELIDAPASDIGVPLDVRGTVFQRQVWAALRAIPAGTTVTYSQLAAAIGRPTATRAVARACGSNPAAVVVPCHRAIGADGSLTGYRWGVERKRALLEREMGDAPPGK